jgi:hypothetical protein
MPQIDFEQALKASKILEQPLKLKQHLPDS